MNFWPYVPNPEYSGLPTAPHPALPSVALAKEGFDLRIRQLAEKEAFNTTAKLTPVCKSNKFLFRYEYSLALLIISLVLLLFWYLY